MGLKKDIKALLEGNDIVLWRPSQTYLSATGAYTVFNVRNGAVLVKSLVGRATAAAVGAVTIASTLNGVAGEAAPVDVGTGTLVGEVVTIPLNVAAVIPGSLGAIPMTDALLYPKGMVVGTAPAGPGLIIITFAAGTSLTMEWSIVYQKLTPNSLITL